MPEPQEPTPPPGCSTAIIAGAWRYAAEGVVLDPNTAVSFGAAIDQILHQLALETVSAGHRLIGKPRLVVRTREAAERDPDLSKLADGRPVIPAYLPSVHTWLIVTCSRTCLHLVGEPGC